MESYVQHIYNPLRYLEHSQIGLNNLFPLEYLLWDSTSNVSTQRPSPDLRTRLPEPGKTKIFFFFFS